MKHPGWFIGGLLAMMALLLVAHVGFIGYGAHRCSVYSQRLQAKFDEMAANDPGATVIHEAIEVAAARCSRLADDYHKASSSYQATILALLGGAGLSAGMDGSRKP